MNIQKVSYTSNSKSSQSFKGLHVTNPKVQKLLLKSFKLTYSLRKSVR